MKNLITVVCAAIIISGCLGKPGSAPIRYFSIVTNPDIQPVSITIPKSIWIADFQAAGRYTYEILHRTDAFGIGYEPFDRWVERPEDMVQRVFAATFETSNLFNEVAFGVVTSPSNYILEGFLLNFDEIRADSIWQAQFSIKLTFGEMLGNRTLWSEIKTVEKPLEFNQSGGFAKAMSAAVLEAARESLYAIEAILKKEHGL